LTQCDIIAIGSLTPTGPAFGNITIAWLKTKEGTDYDILFDEEQMPMEIGKMSESVKALAKFYEKELIIIRYEGIDCWGSIPHWVKKQR
jgi:hypothetical protein